MCGRFALSTPPKRLAEKFELAETPDLPPRYNIAPTQPVAVIRSDPEQAQRRLHMHHWGLVPSWAKDPAIGARMINARAETAAEKPSFRTAFRYRRCLIPADGFYEWERRGKTKQPYLFRMNDGSAFAFAGLWERWKGSEGRRIESCTILTTEPNTLVSPLHNRMPVILAPEYYEVWLDAGIKKPGEIQPFLRPYPPEEMLAYPVSLRVNNPRNDDSSCSKPLKEAL